MTHPPVPVFLLGAGFNADARSEVGPIIGRSIYIGEYEIECRYPTGIDALKISFGLDELPKGSSIEDLYSAAIKGSNYEPMKRLCDELMKADYYLVSRVRSNVESSYYKFFSVFRTSPFLTFNYDALAEAFLLTLDTWYPHDGYGVKVDVEVGYNKRGLSLRNVSRTSVLHLHGSFCIYPSDAFVEWDNDRRFGNLRLRERPKYIFDPDSVGSLFFPFERMLPALGYIEPARRVIAPVPRKATGLGAEFIRDVYARAKGFLRDSERLVAIGYSFGAVDEDSFGPLVDAFSRSPAPKTLIVVDPSAKAITARMRKAYKTVNWAPIESTFADWVRAGFPGVADHE